MRLLFTGTNSTTYIMLREIATACGATCDQVTSGPSALAWMQAAAAPAIVMLDADLDASTRRKCLRLLRDMPPEQYPYLIALVNTTEPEEMAELLQGGVDDLLPLPVSPLVCEARLRAGWRSIALRETIDQLRRQPEEAEAELFRSEQRQRQIIDALPLGVHSYRLEPDGRLIFIGANAAAEQILGMSHLPFIGKTIEEAFPGHLHTDIPERYRQVIRTGHTWHTEQIEYDDGAIAGAFAVHAFQTGPTTMAAAFENITERKKTQIALEHSELKYREIFNATSDALSIHDEQGNILEINEQMCALFGYHADEITNISLDAVCEGIPPYTGDAARQLMYRALTEGPRYVEWRCRRRDGSLFWADAALRGSDIAGERRIIASLRDISERKRSEMEIARLTRLYAALSQINQIIVHVRTREELLRSVCAALVKHGEFALAWIGWLNPLTQQVDLIAADGVARQYVEHLHVSADTPSPLCAITGRAIRDGSPVIRNDCTLDLPTGPWQHAAREADLRASIALPIRQRGEVVGALTVYAFETDTFGAREITLLEEAALDLSYGLDTLLHEADRKRAELRMRAQVDLIELMQQGDLNRLMQRAIDFAEELTESAIGFFHFVNADQQTLTLQAWSTKTLNHACHLQDHLDRQYPIARAGVWVDCLRTRQPVVHNDYASLPGRKGLPPGHARVERELTIPIIRDDQVVAILGVGNKPTEYTQNDIDTVNIIASMVMDYVLNVKGTQALAESETRYRTLVELAPDAVFINVHGTIVYANQAAVRLLRAEGPEDIVGHSWKGIVHPDYHALIEARISSAQQTNLPEPPMEEVYFALDGSHLDVEVIGAPIRYKGEAAILVVVRDISERKRAESDRLDHERRLLHSQKLESLGVLAGGIAHDFNNLLMAMLGNLDISLTRLPVHHAARTSVEQAMQAAHRASDLTRQMLAYSGKGQFAVHAIDMNALVQENAEIFRAAIARTITLSVSLTTEAAVILANPGQIQQIIMNLLTNASEAIGSKAGVISLATGVATYDQAMRDTCRDEVTPTPGAYVYIEVTDTGCGMDRHTQQRLFDPFFTTKFTGRGLGMSAVLGIVQGHHGAIRIDSAPGEGTCIRVYFPICDASTAEKTFVAPTDSGQERTIACSGTVLVVDDDTDVRTPCVQMLTTMGFDTLEADNGVDALRLVEEQHAQLACVLLDLTMPRMDGVATFTAMKRIAPTIPVILCSGYSEQEVQIRFARQQPDGFLQKPYRMQALLDTLSRVLRA